MDFHFIDSFFLHHYDEDLDLNALILRFVSFGIITSLCANPTHIMIIQIIQKHVLCSL